MLCEQCKQREATTHIRRVINGVGEEHHLCAACAQASGLFEGGLSLPEFGLHLGGLFSGFLGESAAALPAASARRCPFCGSSLHEIIQSGNVGCAQCYDTFYDQLEPTLQRVHGSLEHSGKNPESDPKTISRNQKAKRLKALKEQIAAAVREENYEAAAQLRDEIKRLEGGEEDAGSV
ncbi:MAG: UvrB/UvrC motif-containing protein [Oscillospiraceae bacterium]|jgi:protein arginine kinase activator|nr:UvrB/UvrC motif-containing protein [Oscillospiraceae bacterium]